jgi:hypothetical protein
MSDERGVLGPVGLMAPAHLQARAASMAAACAVGSCRYAEPRPIRPGCDGYEARLHVEEGGPLLRWRRCPRSVVWAARERERLGRQHAAEARAKRGREPREWSDGA